MTRREAERLTHQMDTLQALGFTRDEAEALRRISTTLQRWYERECGTDTGCIERDEETDRPYWLNAMSGRRYPIPDRETGARKRLQGILNTRNARIADNRPDDWPDCPTCEGAHPPGFDGDCRDDANRWPSGKVTAALSAYLQTDPRGAALYIIRPGDVPEGADVSSYYSRGVVVY